MSGKETICQCRRHKRHGFDPWVGKILWRRTCNPLQYSCLENPLDKGAWWATARRFVQSDMTEATAHMHDDLQSRQKAIRNFSSLIGLTGKIKLVIWTEPLWHGIQTSQEGASCMVSECHCCQGSFPSEKNFLCLKKLK